ncbi:MAG: 50S ribosomal protein L35 [Candidatus Omnitrophica bacterium]|nr:50S ribosomal protein L35 [Candidatus Omnitrophota bacterium]
MPKLKTKKGVAKRFKITKSGLVKKKSGNRGHLLSKRSSKRKRRLRKSDYLTPVEGKKVRRMMPYG